LAFGEKLPPILLIVWYIKTTKICFLIAGAAGGAIASNIPEYESFDHFAAAKLNVFGPILCWTRPKYYVLAHVENGAFWIGIVTSTVGFMAMRVH
jgi:hypothetical protein